jgi:hypothetical protein
MLRNGRVSAVDRFDNTPVFANVVESSSLAGAAAQKGFQADRPRLTFPVAPGVHPRQRIR